MTEEELRKIISDAQDVKPGLKQSYEKWLKDYREFLKSWQEWKG